MMIVLSCNLSDSYGDYSGALLQTKTYFIWATRRLYVTISYTIYLVAKFVSFSMLGLKNSSLVFCINKV